MGGQRDAMGTDGGAIDLPIGASIGKARGAWPTKRSSTAKKLGGARKSIPETRWTIVQTACRD